MTTRTWNGANADFAVSTDWTPIGVPLYGDLAIIDAGTVTATGTDIAPGVTVYLTGSSAPELLLADATVQPGTRLDVAGGSSNVTLGVTGTVTNDSVVNISQTGSSGNPILSVTDATGGGASSFTNLGTINVVDSIAELTNAGVNAGNQIVNDDIMSFRTTNSSSSELAYVSVPINGTGAIRIGAGYEVQDAQAVGAGQTVLFEARSSGYSTLELDDAGAFNGTIVGFGASDLLRLVTPSYNDAPTISTTNGITTLTFANNGSAIAQIQLAGDYTGSNTSYTETTTNLGAIQTDITTTVPDLPANFAFTDTAVDLVGLEAGSTNTGNPSIAYQFQYNNDPTAIRANVANSEITGGSASDAIQVTSGTNIINAGVGSNFLLGGTGTDTFNMDGTSGVNWDTIVNFHVGDVAALSGFNAGTSTINWTASDGTAGYTGVTLHSELGGAATGFNGSITFAGVSLATEQSSFAITTGPGYIQITYT